MDTCNRPILITSLVMYGYFKHYKEEYNNWQMCCEVSKRAKCRRKKIHVIWSEVDQCIIDLQFRIMFRMA